MEREYQKRKNEQKKQLIEVFFDNDDNETTR